MQRCMWATAARVACVSWSICRCVGPTPERCKKRSKNGRNVVSGGGGRIAWRRTNRETSSHQYSAPLSWDGVGLMRTRILQIYTILQQTDSVAHSLSTRAWLQRLNATADVVTPSEEKIHTHTHTESRRKTATMRHSFCVRPLQPCVIPFDQVSDRWSRLLCAVQLGSKFVKLFFGFKNVLYVDWPSWIIPAIVKRSASNISTKNA